MSWWWVWACVAPVVWAYPTQDLTVGVASLGCSLVRGRKLECNYSNFSQIIKLVDPIEEDTIRSVYIYNAWKLQLSESVCVTLNINNVDTVEVVGSDGAPCDAGTSLTLRKSFLNRLPRQVDRFYLEHSTVGSLTTTTNLTRVSVFNSDIRVLNISLALGKRESASFNNVNIESLQKLFIRNESTLVLQNVTTQSVLSRGLVIEAGSGISMTESSTFDASDESVVMGAGATLTLHRYTGDLKVVVDCTLSDYFKCPSQEIYFTPIIICLVLLIIAIFVIIVLIVYICTSNSPHQKQSLYNVPQSDVYQITENLKEEYEQPLLEETAQITPSDSEHEGSVIISLEKLEELDSLKAQLSSQQQEHKSELQGRISDFEKEMEDLDQLVLFELSRLQEELDNEMDRLDGIEKEDEWISDQEDTEESPSQTVERVQDPLTEIILEAKKKLLNQRYKAKMHDAEHSCNEDKQKLREQLRGHRNEFIKKMIATGRDNLENWIDSRDSDRWTRQITADLDDHFVFLLDKLEEDFEFKAQQEMNRYEMESNSLEQKLREKSRHLDSNYHKVQDVSQSVILPGLGSESNTNFESELYSLIKMANDIKLDLIVRKSHDEELDNLRTSHNTIVQDIQEESIQDIQQTVDVVADVQKLYLSIIGQKLKINGMDKLGSENSVRRTVQIQYQAMNGDSDASGSSNSINL